MNGTVLSSIAGAIVIFPNNATNHSQLTIKGKHAYTFDIIIYEKINVYLIYLSKPTTAKTWKHFVHDQKLI